MKIIDSSTIFDINIIIVRDDFESTDIDLKINLIIHEFNNLSVNVVDFDINMSFEFV